MPSKTKPAPAKPKGTPVPVKPSTPKIIGWTPSGGLMPIYYSKPKPNRPPVVSKGVKKAKCVDPVAAAITAKIGPSVAINMIMTYVYSVFRKAVHQKSTSLIF